MSLHFSLMNYACSVLPRTFGGARQWSTFGQVGLLMFTGNYIMGGPHLPAAGKCGAHAPSGVGMFRAGRSRRTVSTAGRLLRTPGAAEHDAANVVDEALV